jgi:hypothetical protein
MTTHAVSPALPTTEEARTIAYYDGTRVEAGSWINQWGEMGCFAECEDATIIRISYEFDRDNRQYPILGSDTFRRNQGGGGNRGKDIVRILGPLDYDENGLRSSLKTIRVTHRPEILDNWVFVEMRQVSKDDFTLYEPDVKRDPLRNAQGYRMVVLPRTDYDLIDPVFEEIAYRTRCGGLRWPPGSTSLCYDPTEEDRWWWKNYNKTIPFSEEHNGAMPTVGFAPTRKREISSSSVEDYNRELRNDRKKYVPYSRPGFGRGYSYQVEIQVPALQEEVAKLKRTP